MTGFRERVAFDPERGEYRDGAIRYMMIRPDALMGLFAELPPEQRLGALAALGRSVREHGGRSAATYQAMGASDATRMMQTIAETAPQLGWGVWRFHPQPGAVMLDVENSPFAAAAAGSAHPVCHAISGMLTAIGPVLLQCHAAKEPSPSGKRLGGTAKGSAGVSPWKGGGGEGPARHHLTRVPLTPTLSQRERADVIAVEQRCAARDGGTLCQFRVGLA